MTRTRAPVFSLLKRIFRLCVTYGNNVRRAIADNARRYFVSKSFLLSFVSLHPAALRPKYTSVVKNVRPGRVAAECDCISPRTCTRRAHLPDTRTSRRIFVMKRDEEIRVIRRNAASCPPPLTPSLNTNDRIRSTIIVYG